VKVNLMKATGSAQRGNTLVGFILGLVVGLLVALVVAVYVTKVPIPFMNKGLTRNAEQDAAEEKKNKDWDPNAPLYGKSPANNAPADNAKPSKPSEPPGAAEPAPAASSEDPLGDLAASKAQQTEAFQYFVQAGAFVSSADAEGQRAKLALGGFDPVISQREQDSKIIYRVRLGPFDSKSQAEQIQAQLKSNKFESALIRVQR
jgi:cell division protein FtsN